MLTASAEILEEHHDKQIKSEGSKHEKKTAIL